MKSCHSYEWNWWNRAEIMTSTHFDTARYFSPCNLFHSRWWHEEKTVIKVECVGKYKISMNISKSLPSYVWYKTTNSTHKAENNRNFMEFLFHWVTKTIKVASWKLFAQNFLLFRIFMGLKYVQWQQSVEEAITIKFYDLFLRLKKIFFLNVWCSIDGFMTHKRSAGDE